MSIISSPQPSTEAESPEGRDAYDPNIEIPTDKQLKYNALKLGVEARGDMVDKAGKLSKGVQSDVKNPYENNNTDTWTAEERQTILSNILDNPTILKEVNDMYAEKIPQDFQLRSLIVMRLIPLDLSCLKNMH